MSSGVARNAGECNHVHVSAEVTFLPYKWLAELAHRVNENARH
jgi:hypothetical protein